MVAQSAVEKVKQQINGNGGLKKAETLEDMIKKENIQKRFQDVLGKKAPAFISSILSAANSNPNLKSDPISLLSSAMIAATLDLPINSNLGFAHLVPYSGRCQFQMGWKGFVQLAIRTNQYKTINTTKVFEGELVSRNPMTGEIEFDQNGKKSETVIGYVAYFKLLNGFEKYNFMTVEEVKRHGKTYSKSFSNPASRWSLGFDDMALKTVIKQLLSKWGILSVDFQRAQIADQGVFNSIENDPIETIAYPDSKENENNEDKAIEVKPETREAGQDG